MLFLPNSGLTTLYNHITFFSLINLAKRWTLSSLGAFLNSDWQSIIKKQNSKKLTLPFLSVSMALYKESKSFFDRCPAFSIDTNFQSSSFSIFPLETSLPFEMQLNSSSSSVGVSWLTDARCTVINHFRHLACKRKLVATDSPFCDNIVDCRDNNIVDCRDNNTCNKHDYNNHQGQSICIEGSRWLLVDWCTTVWELHQLLSSGQLPQGAARQLGRDPLETQAGISATFASI